MPTYPLSSLLYHFYGGCLLCKLAPTSCIVLQLRFHMEMIQPQDWPTARRERTLPPLSKLITTHDRLRLSELADVASSLGQLSVCSRSASPSPSLDHMLGMYPRGLLLPLSRPLTRSTGELNPSGEAQQCRLPSFSETFSDVIAAHDGVSAHHQYYGHGSQLCPARIGSPVSPGQASFSSSSGPGLSPLSTAHTSPVVSPTTPYYNVPSSGLLNIQLDLRRHQDELPRPELCPKRRLALTRSRRVPSRPAPYGFDAQHHQQRRRACSGRPASPANHYPQQHHPAGASAAPGGRHGNAAGERDRHFNQKYKDPDKLFIIYHKDDLKWGWRAIQERRLELLPVLLGRDYDRSVEERRKVAGLNGMYYRQNDHNMPVLAADGSGLVFVERDGRWWECARSQKCRTAEDGSSSSGTSGGIKGARKGSAGGVGVGGGGAGAGGADTRPRGMVERYPEEVLLYWENHVRHFVPEDKAAEVYARAKRYCEYSPQPLHTLRS